MNSPIFIVSPLNRSGTNFLGRLLDSTEEYSIPEGINEDYFFVYSDYIKKYFKETLKHWNRSLRKENNFEYKHMLKEFGSLLLHNANQKIDDESSALFKCPRPYNISNIFEFIPDAKVIFCVRDGRDTVESFFKSFSNYSFTDIIKLWSEGVNEILSFIEALETENHYKNNVILVKYEDIVNKDPDTLKTITDFCNVNKDVFSPHSIDAFPIFGSSKNRGNAQDLHWQPVVKTNDFNPIGRWESWPIYKRWLFKRYAGDALIKMGYEESNKW